MTQFLEVRGCPEEVRFAFEPGQEDPTYAILPTGLWQCLVRHGPLKITPLKYDPDFVPLDEREGFVYFISNGEAIKIGWSEDVDRRLVELQVGSPVPLTIVGKFSATFAEEQETHRKFQHLRLQGEWFRDVPELHEFLIGRL